MTQSVPAISILFCGARASALPPGFGPASLNHGGSDPDRSPARAGRPDPTLCVVKGFVEMAATLN